MTSMQPGGSQASWRTGPAPSHIGVVGTRRRDAHAGGHGLSQDTGPVRANGFSGELLTTNTSPTESTAGPQVNRAFEVNRDGVTAR